MEKYIVSFLPDHLQIEVEKGVTLLEAERRAGLSPDAPCGGQGTCGKCLVEVVGGGKPGLQKACQVTVDCHMTVKVAGSMKDYSILMEGSGRQVQLSPAVYSVNVVVEKNVLGDSRCEWSRLKAAVAEKAGIDEKEIPANMGLMKNLYALLKETDYKINAVVFENEIIDLRKNDDPIMGIAFDIGTTTIVGYLVDLKTGEEKGRASMLNPQAQFGGDVVMRANYAIEHGAERLSGMVCKALTELIEEACRNAGATPEDVYLITAVGNTCMHHLLLGIVPDALVHAPYNPTVSEPLTLKAAEYNIMANPKARLMLLPNIAGFVGADTAGVMLSAEFDRISAMTLAIDIGTNGELVLGNKDRSTACSTAAGPAFEGAKIQCGMRGAKGAIDHISFDKDGQLLISVIGEVPAPVGICGSGLMDAVAWLLRTGFLDESGKLLSRKEGEASEDTYIRENLNRLGEINGMPAFYLCRKGEDEAVQDVFLTQKDIREVQLAKGAMEAGIYLLAKKLGIKVGDIEQVLIAGAFGNYMDPKSACTIGLIPKELESKIKPVGNSAGEGSKIALLSKDEFRRGEQITKNVEFLELATDPDFQDTFVDCLEFSQMTDI